MSYVTDRDDLVRSITVPNNDNENLRITFEAEKLVDGAMNFSTELSVEGPDGKTHSVKLNRAEFDELMKLHKAFFDATAIIREASKP